MDPPHCSVFLEILYERWIEKILWYRMVTNKPPPSLRPTFQTFGDFLVTNKTHLQTFGNFWSLIKPPEGKILGNWDLILRILARKTLQKQLGILFFAPAARIFNQLLVWAREARLKKKRALHKAIPVSNDKIR